MVEKSSERPTGVTILAVLAFVSGGLTLLGGLVALVSGPMVGSMYGGIHTTYAGMAMAGFVGAIIMAAVSFLVGYLLWTGSKIGWWLTAIGSVLGILSILTLNIVNFLIGAVVLWYLLKPHVKDYFGVTEVEFST